MSESPLSAGAAISHYRIVSKIGAGGMGEVYLAEDTRLRRKVALKILSAELTKNADRLRRFEQEAFAASALSHPNILVIYEIGADGEHHFIATEFIEGETLRDRMARRKMDLEETLDVAVQVASALAAAHKAGIVHRDIKPENIMLREDSYAKVLDFGLAKLIEQQGVSTDTEAKTVARIDTDPGTVMGTVNYMSPEQAKGKTVDARTDVFSLGVLTYEMVAGRTPFQGESSTEVLAAILDREPPPLARFEPEAPAELQRIVSKALRKNREERYQTIKDLLIDLKNLRGELDFEARLERSMSPESASRSGSMTGGGAAALPVSRDSGAESSQAGAVRTTSSAEYFVSQIKSHKRGAAIVSLAFIVAIAGAVFLLGRGTPALTDKDTVLLADFANTTGDGVFDGTLKQGLAVQLEQSPFLNLFPDARVRQTLRLMGRSPDERVTAEIGREICERQGLKCLIAGAIAPLGSHFVVTLEALNGHSGEVVAREQVEAESKEQVLKALSNAASRMREKLGESLSSIQKFDASLELTTSSLEALKAYSLGDEQKDRGKNLEAIPYFKRAVELDPNFAYAYAFLSAMYADTNQPRLAAEAATKAYALRDRVSELEKLRVTNAYHTYVTGELDRAIEVLEFHKRTYPRDYTALISLSDRYLRIGQWEKAIVEAREALSLSANNAVANDNLVQALIGLNRFEEAKANGERTTPQKLDGTAIHIFLYQIAFATGDMSAMQEQLTWASGRPDEHVAFNWQADTAAFAGQRRRAEDLARRSIDLASRNDAKEVAAQYAAGAALRDAAFGQLPQAKASIAQSLALESNRVSLVRAALARALCGELSEAQRLVDELVKRYPKDTLINGIWIPTIRATLELQRGNAAQAIELLQPAGRYEAAAEFWPQYVRGLVYLKLNQGTEAVAEFQKILNHRGEAALSTLYPLAHLGLARGAAVTGDTGKCRKAYQDFFALWKDADPDLLILTDAKKEYERLK